MDRERLLGYIPRRYACLRAASRRCVGAQNLHQRMKLHISLSAVLIAAVLAQTAGGGISAAVAQFTPSELSVCGWGQGQSDDSASRDSLGLTELTGAIFDRPEHGSPAAGAGIESGDVITAITAASLTSACDFATTISKMSPGTIVHFTTWRNGELMEIKLTLGSSKCPRGT